MKYKPWSYDNYIHDMIMEDAARAELMFEQKSEIIGNDSLDSQIDKHLSSYENEAANALKEQARRLGYGFLFEAPEENEEDSEEEDLDLDELEDDEEEPEELKTSEDIDVHVFADNVNRMIENVENLLEFKKTLMRRSANYLAKSYDSSTVRQFMTIMEDEYGLSTDKSKHELDNEDEAPRAGRAGPIST